MICPKCGYGKAEQTCDCAFNNTYCPECGFTEDEMLISQETYDAYMNGDLDDEPQYQYIKEDDDNIEYDNIRVRNKYH
jgi:hypothetical protein